MRLPSWHSKQLHDVAFILHHPALIPAWRPPCFAISVIGGSFLRNHTRLLSLLSHQPAKKEKKRLRLLTKEQAEGEVHWASLWGQPAGNASCIFINLRCTHATDACGLSTPLNYYHHDCCYYCNLLLLLLFAVVVIIIIIITISIVLHQNISVMTAYLVCLTRMQVAIAFSAPMCGSAASTICLP